MTMTTRKNSATKALQSTMAKAKKWSTNALIEWELSCNTNANRGNVYGQEDIMAHYSRRGCGAKGASKICHLYNHVNGEAFEYIVIKRHRVGGYIDEHAYDSETKQTGNQLLDEVACWCEFAERAEADLLCPILKYFTSKSDKVEATSETMQRNIIIIAQRAVYVSDAHSACRKAEELNRANGYRGEERHERYEKLEKLSRAQGWRDAMFNGGNSGVIFDYAKNCYKAVFIDYAL